jgi:hypothetical protein
MKETWESVRALDALLKRDGMSVSSCEFFGKFERVNLQPCPDVDVAAGNLVRAEENVTAEATSTVNPH